jgi:hypothetical protein
VTVEGQVRAVDRDVVIEQELELLVERAGDRACSSPEQSVVDEEQVGTGVDRLSYAAERGVDCGGDTRYGPGVFHLESVVSSRVVGSRVGLQQIIEPGNDVREGGGVV